MVELLVTLIILGIIIAVAMPVYTSYIRQGRRAEAYQALLAIEQRQQRYYLFNSNYTSSISSLGLSTQSNTGLYSLSITSATTTGYTATATASGSQLKDTSTCQSLQLSVATSTVTYSPQSCWGQ